MENRKITNMTLANEQYTPLAMSHITDDRERMASELEVTHNRPQTLKANSTEPTAWTLARTTITNQDTIMETWMTKGYILKIEWKMKTPTRYARATDNEMEG